MPFPGRAGKALKGEACVAEGLFYGSFAAVGDQHGAGRASCGNVAENLLIPQVWLCGRGDCVVEYYGRPLNSTCFPIVFFFQCCNVSAGLVQYEFRGMTFLVRLAISLG